MKEVRKIIIFLSVFITMVASNLGFLNTSLAHTIYDNELDTVNLTALNVNNTDFYTSLIRQESAFSGKTVSAVKQLSDFSGFTYYVVETKPYGYIIFDNVFSTALVMNPFGVSPYYGFYENLIFGGATHYYVKPEAQPRNGDSLFIHTVLNTHLVVNAEDEEILIKASEEMAEAVMSIDNSHELERSSRIQIATINNQHVITETNTRGWRNDGQYGAFNHTGNCGFVAGSLLVWYQRQARGWSQFAPRRTFDYQLVLDIQGNRNDATWGHDLDRALTQYSRNHGNRGPARYTPIPTRNHIFNMVNNNRPTALLGRMPNISETSGNKFNHVVVVHRVQRTLNTVLFVTTRSNYFFYVHYGWANWGNSNQNNVRLHESVITRSGVVYF